MILSTQIAADCREGKHATCYGEAWDDAKDELGACLCPCHQEEQAADEDPEVLRAFSVYVYKPEDSCVQCTSTIRELKANGIPFQERVVRKADTAQVEELKRIAADKNVAPQMPYVMVIDDDTEDIHSWFGFQPDEIKKLKASA